MSRRLRALVAHSVAAHSVAARRHHQESPPFGTLWFRYSGVIFTLAVAVSTELAFGTPLQNMQPTPLLLVAVVYTIVTGKLLAGMTSTGIAVTYQILFFALHGSALRYSAGAIIALSLIIPLTAAMVGVLRKRETDAWTERERLQSERARAQTHTHALEHANQRMDVFLGVASHELRSPLAALRLNLQQGARQLIRAAASGGSASDGSASGGSASGQPATISSVGVLALLERADSQVDRIDRLVSDLLDVSRLRSGSLSISPAPCDLAALVSEVASVYAQIAPERRITVEVAEAPVMVQADAHRIRQVVENFLNNALRYDHSGQPIAVALSADPTEVRITVRDHGPGIPLAWQRAIWERFQRAAHTTGSSIGEATGGGGLGLGLYISRELIACHGGRIGVESRPGVGSSFWFTLARQPMPAAEPATAPAQAAEAQPLAEAFPVALG
jgi:signal transduction histidine kinase